MDYTRCRTDGGYITFIYKEVKTNGIFFFPKYLFKKKLHKPLMPLKNISQLERIISSPYKGGG